MMISSWMYSIERQLKTSHQIISLSTIHFLSHQFSRKSFIVYWLLYWTLARLVCFLMNILVRTKSTVCTNVILQPVMRLTNVSDKYWLHKKVIVKKPMCAPSCLRSFPNIAFETVTMFVWLTAALTHPSRKIIKHFLFLRCFYSRHDGVIFLALCLQVVSQAPEHFRPSKTQANDCKQIQQSSLNTNTHKKTKTKKAKTDTEKLHTRH